MTEVIVRPVQYDELTECLVTGDGEYIGLIIDGEKERTRSVGKELANLINRNDKFVINEFLAEAYTRYDKYCQCGHMHQVSRGSSAPCSECDCKAHRYLSRKKAIEMTYRRRFREPV